MASARRRTARQAPAYKRHPIHVGTRATGFDTNKAWCLSAMPVFTGEVVRGLRIDSLATTRIAETNFDQPPIFEMYGAFIPWSFGANTSSPGLTVAELDNLCMGTIQTGDDIPLGGDPSLDPTANWMGYDDFNMARVFMRRQRIGLPVPVGLDELGNADARFFDQFHTKFDTPIRIKSSGMVCIFAMTHSVDANTVFGVELLSGVANGAQSIVQALMRPGDTSGGQQQDQAQALFYGGDNYIESDSFKATERRHFAIVQATIVGPPTLGRRG